MIPQTAPIDWEERQYGKRKSESEVEVFLDAIYVTRITLHECIVRSVITSAVDVSLKGWNDPLDYPRGER